MATAIGVEKNIKVAASEKSKKGSKKTIDISPSLRTIERKDNKISLKGRKLAILLEDGFDEKIIEARNVNIESGRGFFNMYERTEYINGHLEIKSAPGQGTTVRLTVPLRTPATVDL